MISEVGFDFVIFVKRNVFVEPPPHEVGYSVIVSGRHVGKIRIEWKLKRLGVVRN